MKISDLLTEAKIGREYQHLEDLLITDGSRGGIAAAQELGDIAQNPESMSMKWDGIAAVFWGRDEQGRFQFAPLNQWNKGQKLDRTGLAKEIMATGRPGTGQSPEEFAAQRQGLAAKYQKMWDLLEKATPKDFRGYLNADLMFSEKQQPGPDGAYEFTPNKVTYRVEPKGLFGRMPTAEIFLAVHGKIDEFGAPATGNIKPISSDEVMRFNATPSVVVLPTEKPRARVASAANKAKALESHIAKHAAAIDAIVNYSKPKFTNIRGILYDYAVARSKSGDSLDFNTWVQSSKLSEPQRANLQELINTHKAQWRAFWDSFDRILSTKHEVLDQVSQQHGSDMASRLGITATTAGKPGGEGFVTPMKGGQLGKLVNPAFRSAPPNPRFSGI